MLYLPAILTLNNAICSAKNAKAQVALGQHNRFENHNNVLRQGYNDTKLPESAKGCTTAKKTAPRALAAKCACAKIQVSYIKEIYDKKLGESKGDVCSQAPYMPYLVSSHYPFFYQHNIYNLLVIKVPPGDPALFETSPVTNLLQTNKDACLVYPFSFKSQKHTMLLNTRG